MKKLATLLMFVILQVSAKETIIVVNPQGPSHSGTPQLMAVVNEANKQQYNRKFKIDLFQLGLCFK